MPLKRLFCWFVSFLLIGVSPLASGHGYQLGDLKIIHPWAMPTAASMHGGAGGMGFFIVRTAGQNADKLLSVSAAITQKIEIHQYLKGAQPAMQHTESLDIPASADMRLEPGGSHLMFMGLEKPLVEGDHFPITLQFERSGKITVDMMVQMQAKEMTD